MPAAEPPPPGNFSNQVRCLHLSAVYLAADPAGHDGLSAGFGGARLEKLLKQCASLLAVRILSFSRTDYEPAGASAAALLAETGRLAHLDQSHLAVHTYTDPELSGARTPVFRLDLDAVTCGRKSPALLLRFLHEELQADFYVADLLLRGFTRLASGAWHFPGRDEVLPGLLAELGEPLQVEHEWSERFRQHRLKLVNRSTRQAGAQELLEQLLERA